MVTELRCADPASLELAFRAGANQVVDSVDRPLDHGVVARNDVTAAIPTPALTAVWCRSVGTTWTVELHKFDHGTALGPIVDWISSGVPISDPEPPAELARELLRTRVPAVPRFVRWPLQPSPAPHWLRVPRRRSDHSGHPRCAARPQTHGYPTRRISDPRCVTPSRRTSRDGATETAAARPQIPTLRPGAVARRTGHGSGL